MNEAFYVNVISGGRADAAIAARPSESPEIRFPLMEAGQRPSERAFHEAEIQRGADWVRSDPRRDMRSLVRVAAAFHAPQDGATKS